MDIPELKGLGPKLVSRLKTWSAVRGRCSGWGCISPVTRAFKGKARAPNTALTHEDRALSPPPAWSLQDKGSSMGPMGQPLFSAPQLSVQ